MVTIVKSFIVKAPGEDEPLLNLVTKMGGGLRLNRPTIQAEPTMDFDQRIFFETKETRVNTFGI